MAKDQVKTAEDVFDIVASYMNKENVEMIRRAYQVAYDAHMGQLRKSGEPYIVHPVQVAGILAELEMDPATAARRWRDETQQN